MSANGDLARMVVLRWGDEGSGIAEQVVPPMRVPSRFASMDLFRKEQWTTACRELIGSHMC
jgi:hypothetical protein